MFNLLKNIREIGSNVHRKYSIENYDIFSFLISLISIVLLFYNLKNIKGVKFNIQT